MTNSIRMLHLIRERNPTRAANADKGSRKSAIQLFCTECMGGSVQAVRHCPDKECPLFCFRTGPFIPGGADNTERGVEEIADIDDEGEETADTQEEGEPIVDPQAAKREAGRERMKKFWANKRAAEATPLVDDDDEAPL